ncbi:unnamed protein product [Rhodiola kirilowii]
MLCCTIYCFNWSLIWRRRFDTVKPDKNGLCVTMSRCFVSRQSSRNRIGYKILSVL